MIAEDNGGTGALISDYIYSGSRMVARDQSGVLKYYHQDGLSARLITNAIGTVVGTEDHLPFGEEAGFTGETEKHRFTSYERDSESHTDYAINRQHQYVNGRFMQPDPIAGTMLYPQSLNRYSYTSGDPANWTDPLGLVRENTWSLWAGFGLLGGTNITWDGGSVSQYVLGMVAHLWMSGAANIIPQGWELNSSGQLANAALDIAVDNPNDYWRSLPIGFQRSDRDTKADVDWARSVMKDGMPFPPAPTENIRAVMDCYNKWKFSSTIAGLVGEEFRGIAEAFEIGSLASLGSDIPAVIRKSQRSGVGGSAEQYASGMNRLFRAIGKTLNLPSSVRKGLTSVGDISTKPLAVVGALLATMPQFLLNVYLGL